jgi:xanthine dehydrogenase accessory factor
VVIRAFFSTPRKEGSVMLATADGRLAGSVSGGCVEGAACEEISRALATGLSRVVRYGITDEQALDVGLACGGVIDVLIESAVPEAAAAAALEGGAPDSGIAVITPLPADSPGPAVGPHRPGQGSSPAPVLMAGEDGRLDGSLGDQALDAELALLAADSLARGISRTVYVGGRGLFIETFPVRPRLVVVGAGQVAVPLVAIAHTLGYETVVVDARPAFAARERFPDADRIVVGWPDEVADEISLNHNDAVAVLSHDPRFDDPAVLTAAARGCRYVGVIGSRRTQRERRLRLASAGLGPEALTRLRGPIGLDLGGRSPAETALAIMAEIVAVRFGGTGLPMIEKALAEAAPSGASGNPAPTSATSATSESASVE